MDLKIGSINVRGLGDQVKRREIFNWLRAKKYSVYFIQEMHCTEDNKNDWLAEWGYQALFSCCSSKKAGVAILFNNNFTFQISKTYSDPEGRFIICDLTVNGKQLTLTNIYAPNNDDSNFFTSVFSHLADFKCEFVIIGRGCLVLLTCVGGCCVLKLCKGYVPLVLNFLVLIRHPCVLIVSE